jgi:hypothetical protein
MAEPVAYWIEFDIAYVMAAAPADTSSIDKEKCPNTRIKVIDNATNIAQTDGGFIYLVMVVL